jgi:dephospho-CoA kinase
MLIIGLTGGIGSGKTAVSDRFAALGVPVVDTDLISRQLVEPGHPLLQTIIREFGDSYLDTSGRLDRPALGKLIFSDPQARYKLESILHPAIRREAQKQMNQLQADYAILVIPLLAENGADYSLDRVLVVDTPESLQIERAMQRDGSSRKSVQNILGSQASRTQRLHLADDVIINDADLSALNAAVDKLHAHYLQLTQ